MIHSLVFVVLTTAVAYFLSVLAGAFGPTLAILSILVALVGTLRGAPFLVLEFPEVSLQRMWPGRKSWVESLVIAFLGLVAYRHFLWLFFPIDHAIATLNPNNLGDLPLHVNYIELIKHGARFPPMNPEFGREVLRYPLGADLFSSVLCSLGLPLSGMFFVTGVLFTLLTLVLLSAYAGWLGIVAFFLSAGTQGASWRNLFLNVFTTQRGIQMALPMGLLLLVATRRKIFLRADVPIWVQGLLGVIWGFLPLVHIHSFLAVSLMIALSNFSTDGWAGVKKIFTGKIFQIAFLPALYFLILSADFGQKAQVIHWEWLWGEKKNGVLEFILGNFYLWSLIPFLCFWKIRDAKTPQNLQRGKEFLFYFLLFVLFLNLMLAPWAWDNIKVLIWPFLGMAQVAYLLFAKDFKDWQKCLFIAAFCFFGIQTTLQSLAKPARQSVTLYRQLELGFAKGALKGTSADAIFAAAQDYDHPLTYFGKIRDLGYDGHLWTHGIDASGQKDKHQRLLRGDESWEALARDLKIDFIYWGPREVAQYGSEVKPWMKVLKNVSGVPEVGLYQFKTIEH